MDTLVNRMQRRSPLLLAALLTQTTIASIPEGTVSPTVAPRSAAAAPTLVRVEADPFTLRDALADSMNACVAQIVAHELDQAVATCDRAVGIARTERVATSNSIVNMVSRREATKLLAAAVSNRAVLKWMKSDPSYASDL